MYNYFLVAYANLSMYTSVAVIIKNKIYSVNIMMQLDGTGQLLHLKQTWTGSWNLRLLLVHIVELLYTPKVDLIPIRLRQPVV